MTVSPIKIYLQNFFFPILMFFIITIAGEATSSGTIGEMSGLASWYAEFSPGINKTTANMETFDDQEMTCASWDFPFDTILKVTNTDNSKSVFVRVNDRGPAKRLYREGRIIDLTMGAFKKIANTKNGLINVKVAVADDYSVKN
ncbi:MAG TPA: septal ring lytic transglycosylase RlpA family protein [Candidatus Omnitrophota bacterium]|nr:septal ring lytic transglycosylase RlpA family protein [Candidatus Omnitrophota bacterium]